MDNKELFYLKGIFRGYFRDLGYNEALFMVKNYIQELSADDQSLIRNAFINLENLDDETILSVIHDISSFGLIRLPANIDSKEEAERYRAYLRRIRTDLFREH